MKKIKKIIHLSLFFSMLIIVCSCYTAGINDGFELVDVSQKFGDVEYELVNGTKGKIRIEDFVDDLENIQQANYKSLSFYPKKEISHDFFVAMSWTIYSDEYKGSAMFKITIEDEIISYEEEIKTEIIDGEEITKTELIEVKKTEIINITDAAGEAININEKGQDYGASLEYKIKSYSSSTCFKFELLNTEGTDNVEYNWAVDFVQILVNQDS